MSKKVPQKAEFKTQEGWDEYEKCEAMEPMEWAKYFCIEWNRICHDLGAVRPITVGCIEWRSDDV